MGATKPAGSPAELTGKERLGEKWKDEQRLTIATSRSTSVAQRRGPIAVRMYR